MIATAMTAKIRSTFRRVDIDGLRVANFRNTIIIHRVKKRFFVSWIVSLVFVGACFWFSSFAQAEDLDFSIRQAVVWVHCGNRQGSGVIINSEKGYILTNAHILLDLTTLKPDPCEMGFITDNTLKPTVFYNVGWEKFVYDESQNQDFAILRIAAPLQETTLPFFSALKTDEFSKTNDPISIVGFPGSAKGKQIVTQGTIEGLEKGIIKTDAVISPGSSGGAGIDTNHHLTGIATRILLKQFKNGEEEVVHYELVDIRNIINWLDTFGDNAHDLYIQHADPERYHGIQAYFTPGKLNCALLAKSIHEDTVYCLRGDGTRSVFPNSATYHTWFADFSGIISVSDTDLATYRLTANITMRPGTLVKIATDPKVYIVADMNGTLRHLESETHAKELFGDGWAGFVKDIPDTYFTNYTIGTPIK